MLTVCTYFCRSAASLSDSIATFDQERQSWSQRPDRRRFQRLTKTTICLILTDLMFVGMVVSLLEPLIILLWRNEELFRPQVPLLGDAPTLHTDPAAIPRILHQTCANSTIPSKWVNSQQTCKEVYSDFEYKVCNNSSLLNDSLSYIS